MRQYINWKTYLIVIALFIVAASLIYTNKLSVKLANEEKRKMEQVVEGIKTLNKDISGRDLSFIYNFVYGDTTIPFILTDDKNNIIGYRNIDTTHTRDTRQLLKEKLFEYKSKHAPIVSDFGAGKDYVYYGESYMLTQLRYFPYVQLGIIILFLAVVLVALSSAHRSIRNQVWVGLSKETAHQLGTPLSSIEAWMELLKEHEVNKEAIIEMQNDLDRLKLVADRFSKVGSAPQLVEENLAEHLQRMVDYMQRRAPNKVTISLETNETDIPVNMSGALFDWVMENLIKNALDAIAGSGTIQIKVVNTPSNVVIDIKDNGKGIPSHLIKKVFNPGFTTKKRGWGLGLSLSKRIIEKYHHGSLFVKQSEIGKGSTFRIILRR